MAVMEDIEADIRTGHGRGELKCIAEYEEEKSIGKVADFRPNNLILGLPPHDYVLHAVSNVHSKDL